MSLQKLLFGDVVVAVIKCVSQTVLRLSWYDIMSFENAPLFPTDNKTIDFLFYKSVQFQFDCFPKLLSSDASVSVSSFQSIQGQKAQKVCALVNKKTLTGSKKFTQWCEVPLPLKPNKGKCLFSDSRLLKVFFFLYNFSKSKHKWSHQPHRAIPAYPPSRPIPLNSKEREWNSVTCPHRWEMVLSEAVHRLEHSIHGSLNLVQLKKKRTVLRFL